MIRNLRVEGFKRFLDGSFDLGALTVLCGLNGAGKSSAVQALLLSRLAVTAADGDTLVPLNGPFGLGLGEAIDVLNTDADSNRIRFTITSDDSTAVIGFDVSEERSLMLGPFTVDGPPEALAGPDRTFTFLSAERLGPRDLHAVESSDPDRLNVGHRGEFSAQVLVVAERLSVDEGRRHPDTPDDAAVTLRAQVERWLSTIVCPTELDAQWLPAARAAQLRFRRPGGLADWVQPANTGFGLSYTLPIVVAGLTMEPGGMLVVENPEAHLHPAGQSAIGIFLARVAAAGIQVVVETHSEHVVNGVRLAVARGPVLSPDQVRLLYVANAEVQTLLVNETGSVSAWPPGFFDQLELDLASLARSKRR
jgi:predicted ATPase